MKFLSDLRNIFEAALYFVIAQFYFCLLFPLGFGPLGRNFFLYRTNPKKLSKHHIHYQPIILLHGSLHNPTAWIPLLRLLRKSNYAGPIYTIKYDRANRVKILREKIQTISDQYKKMGIPTVDITLIGHSLGLITSMEYFLEQSNWVKGTSIKCIISISGRMKDQAFKIFNRSLDWSFASLRPSLRKIEAFLKTKPFPVPLYIIGGDHDWLVPQSAIFVTEDKRKHFLAINRGHFSILLHGPALKQIHQWLTE